MVSHILRRHNSLPSNELLPVDYHGLMNTDDQLRAHANQFRRTKHEIAQGKRSRRNSQSDTRARATIEADGPDKRYTDVVIPDSGLRDGLAAVIYMPEYSNVRAFTRASARWEEQDQLSVSEVDESRTSGSGVSTEGRNDFSREHKDCAIITRQRRRFQADLTPDGPDQFIRDVDNRDSLGTADHLNNVAQHVTNRAVSNIASLNTLKDSVSLSAGLGHKEMRKGCADEERIDAEVNEEPAKRRKMSWAEYRALRTSNSVRSTPRSLRQGRPRTRHG